MQGALIRYLPGPSWSGNLRGVFSSNLARLCAWMCLFGSLTIFSGCSQRASRVQPVEIDASSASTQAMELYDKNGDGALAGDELNAIPAMKKHLDKYDKDSNQKVTRNEIAERIQVWTSSQLALLGATFSIRLDGRPLDGATVTLIPESYLGPDVKSASGVTNSVGLTRASHAEEDLPKTASGRPLYGVKAGTYKIQITHPSRKIPAKYNTATEIGEEIAPDINPTQAPIRLSLTSQ